MLICLFFSSAVNPNDEEEATGDDHTIFSELQLSSGTEKSIFHLNKLDADARLQRLRRSNIDDQRVSSAASTSTRSMNTEEKVSETSNDRFDSMIFVC